MSYSKNDNIILLVSLIAVSLAATILGPYKAHPAFAATVDVSIPKGASILIKQELIRYIGKLLLPLYPAIDKKNIRWRAN